MTAITRSILDPQNSDNGVGVAGTAGGKEGGPGVSLMTLTTFGKTSTGGFAEALTYGADNGASISSNSWGYTTPGAYSQAEIDAVSPLPSHARLGPSPLMSPLSLSLSLSSLPL